MEYNIRIRPHTITAGDTVWEYISKDGTNMVSMYRDTAPNTYTLYIGSGKPAARVEGLLSAQLKAIELLNQGE